MKWRAVWTGVKVGLAVVIKVNGLIKIKGIDKIKTVKEIVDDIDVVIPKQKPAQGATLPMGRE